MQPTLTLWRHILSLVAAVERVLLVLLIANIVLNITAQVVSRYAFGRPLVWVEEVAVYSFIWATFVGAGLGLKYGRHVKIETFVSRMSARRAALPRALVFALILVFALWMLPFVSANMALEMRRSTIALPFHVPMGWFFSMPLLVGLVSMAFTAAYRMLVEINLAVGGAPQPPILGEPREEEDDDLEAERAFSGERP